MRYQIKYFWLIYWVLNSIFQDIPIRKQYRVERNNKNSHSIQSSILLGYWKKLIDSSYLYFISLSSQRTRARFHLATSSLKKHLKRFTFTVQKQVLIKIFSSLSEEKKSFSLFAKKNVKTDAKNEKQKALSFFYSPLSFYFFHHASNFSWKSSRRENILIINLRLSQNSSNLHLV